MKKGLLSPHLVYEPTFMVLKLIVPGTIQVSLLVLKSALSLFLIAWLLANQSFFKLKLKIVIYLI